MQSQQQGAKQQACRHIRQEVNPEPDPGQPGQGGQQQGQGGAAPGGGGPAPSEQYAPEQQRRGCVAARHAEALGAALCQRGIEVEGSGPANPSLATCTSRVRVSMASSSWRTRGQPSQGSSKGSRAS